MKIQEVSEVD